MNQNQWYKRDNIIISSYRFGISVFNQPQSSVSNKIMYSRLDGYNNFTLFPYNMTKDTLNWYEPIYETLDFYIE